MKGQIFIMIIFLILITLILLRIESKPVVELNPSPLVEKFLNLKNELIQTNDASFLIHSDPFQIRNELDKFIDASKSYVSTQGYKENILYSFDYNGSTVVLGNFLGTDLYDIKVVLTSSTGDQSQSFYVLKDRESRQLKFSSISGWYIVSVTSDKRNFTYSGYYFENKFDTMSEYFDIYLGFRNSYLNETLSLNRTLYRRVLV